MSMRWASAVSELPATTEALAAVYGEVREQLGGERADLVVAFVSPHHASSYDTIAGLLAAAFPGARVLGCSAGGVIGGGHEVEERPGFSLTAAALPDVKVTPLRAELGDVPAVDAGREAWDRWLGVAAIDDPHFVVLPDPFTFEPEALLGGLDKYYPTATKVGGLASGGRQGGANALWLDGATYRNGVVGVALTGDIAVDSIVAQGCRPIGNPMFVTRCRRNLLIDVDGRPVMDVLMELFQALPRRDQELLRHSLFLGVVMREDQQKYGHGDFLIRNILGQERESKGLVVGAVLREHQVVQFHLRDADTSRDDLVSMLDRYRRSGDEASSVAGALLFSCLGRGAHLYGQPDHDTSLFAEHLGARPLGGFFCSGEIGPVGGATFLHGYTSSFGLFRPKR